MAIVNDTKISMSIDPLNFSYAFLQFENDTRVFECKYIAM